METTRARARTGTLGPCGPFRWPSPLVGDVLIALLWALACAVPGPHATLLLLPACAALVRRRRYPLTVALAVGAWTLATAVVWDIGAPLPEALAAFAAGSAVLHRASAPLVGVVSVLWILTLFGVTAESPRFLLEQPAHAVMIALTGTVPVLAGSILRMRVERAEQRLRAERARLQRELARDRARIARDVHDIAGHHLSAIRLLAVGGREALRGPDARPDQVLSTIAETSGRAVSELRSLVELLRDDHWNEAPPPNVRLTDLSRLVMSVEDAGLDVALSVPSAPDEGVDARVAASVYRITQEALGNVLRHSSARRVTVTLKRSERRDAADLVLTVLDDGRPAPDSEERGSTPGLGLRGMRERAAEVGGHAEAGFLPGRGWRVRAVLPATLTTEETRP
ncbi:sensor histidine kinase [Nocardiopsis sp. MG754419]|uniref:sensor histidine kinase n=1 Tax=Nocardiopsis sp. MG754419 TaxID=2259865 RepID=UPI001BAC57A2|nr:histidine kinase [Nocardiopsis sp. MG754419]MBR8741688.1 ATP-binding protein [Nocardiopsis sp. MG754419]